MGHCVRVILCDVNKLDEYCVDMLSGMGFDVSQVAMVRRGKGHAVAINKINTLDSKNIRALLEIFDEIIVDVCNM